MKILFTGGGTGGHIVPIIALSREIRKLREDVEFIYVGPKDNFAQVFFEQEDVPITNILAGKIRRYADLKSTIFTIFDLIFKTPIGVLQSFIKIFIFSPDLVFSKGGYGAVPISIAAWMLRVPVFLHESDVTPGLANKIIGHFAHRIFISFEGTRNFPKEKMTIIGNPIRKEILSGDAKEAIKIFHISSKKPLLAILGGSQGSVRLNDMILQILDKLLLNFEIVHQTGDKNFKQIVKESKVVVSKENLQYYHPVPFLKETALRHLYSVADFIVNRAGSGSIFEIAALGKPSILIPLPEAAQNHQAQNAYEYGKTGAAIILEEANLTPHFFFEKLEYLFAHPKELEKMKSAAIKFSKPEAANNMAEIIVDYLYLSN